MAKVVTEVAIGAAAIGAAIALPGIGEALWLAQGMVLPAGLQGALFGIGASSVMAGMADALRSNQGGIAVGVTTPIGPWGYIYGTQKVGGIEIFRESNNSQGTSNRKELHRVYALACHPCHLGAWQLRIDGKQVMMAGDSPGWKSIPPPQLHSAIQSIARQDGVVTIELQSPMAGQDGNTVEIRSVRDNSFNGVWTVTQPDPSDATLLTYVCGGPDTTSSGGNARTTYSDYKDKIHIEMLDGNHTATFPGLLASGTSWTGSDLCLGHTLAYVRMGYDEQVFPSSIPNVSFVIDGKNDILDPHTGVRGFTRNAALCIADYMSLPASKGGFGLAIGTDIPNAPLIAAANLCDELVPLAAGGTIRRYTCDTFVQLNMARGTILKDLLSSCAGRISYQGGQYYIVPAGCVAPTLQLGPGDMVGPIKTRPRFGIRDTCNAIKGTYVSPENAYQQADVPAYMQDARHGYVADPWLAEDHGERIFKEANFPCTNHSAIAQRLAKIALLRMRFQKRVTIACSLKAYQAVALDVIQLSHPRYGWENKLFEVLSSRFVLDKSNGQAPRPYVELDLAETDDSIYDWFPTEQLTPQGYKQPNNVGVRICAPPEDVTAYSGPGETVNGIVYPSTVTTGADGRLQNSIYVRWNQPNDANVVSGGHLEVQFQLVGASGSWTPAGGKIDPSADHIFILGVNDGEQYNVQARAVNCANVPSEWIISGPVTVSSAVSSLTYAGIPVAPAGTLTAQARSDGTGQITIAGFIARVGAATANCTPSPAALTGLSQGQFYYVYYVDANFAGGTITPVATQDVSDFESRAGYWLIGSIVIPTYQPRYQPSGFADFGSGTTANPQAAYDNNPATDAIVQGSWWTESAATFSSSGACSWMGFPSLALDADATLHVLAAAAGSSPRPFTCTITVSVGGTITTLLNISGVAAKQDYTLLIPAGTNLSTIAVTARASSPAGLWSDSPNHGGCSLQGFEIYIQ